MSFGTNLGQNTIRKNKMTRKMTAQTSKPWRSYFLMWHSRREADHCADSAFPYLYYRRQHADCQAPEGIAIRWFLWYPYLQERRCSASAAVMLPFLGSPMCRTLRGSSIFVALRGYECFYTWVTQGGIPLWKFGIMFSPCSPFWSLSSLARPRSLGRLPKRFFVTRTAQNTIRKNNDKKNDRLGSQSDGGHVF